MPQSFDRRVTHCYLVLQVFNGIESIYARMQGVNGSHDQIIIHSLEDIKDLMVTGYVFPVLKFVGRYALENIVTGLHVGIKSRIRVSAAQGYMLKRNLKREHRTQIYLMAGKELKIGRDENVENCLVHKIHEEFTPSHSVTVLPSAPGATENGHKHQLAGSPSPVLSLPRPVSPLSRPVSPLSRLVSPPPRPLYPPTRLPHSISYFLTLPIYPVIE